MPTYTKSEIQTRPNYGHLRVKEANTELASESVRFEQSPRELDIIMDTSGNDAPSVMIGTPKSEHDRPGLALGKVSIRRADHGGASRWTDSLRGGPSRLAAALLTGRNNLQIPHRVGDTLNGMSNLSHGIMVHRHNAMLHSFPVEDAENRTLIAGAGDTDYVGLRTINHCVLGSRINGETLQRLSRHQEYNEVSSINLGVENVSDGAQLIIDVTRPNSAFTPHYLATGIEPGSGNRRGAFFHTASDATEDSRFYNVFDEELHGQLAKTALNTPDEYFYRNYDAILDLIERLPYLIENDVVGSFQKGGRSRWWTRASDESLAVMGDMIHLGMCLRLGRPIQNCYRFSNVTRTTVDPDSSGTQELDEQTEEEQLASAGTDDSSGGDSTTIGQEAIMDGETIELLSSILDAELPVAVALVGYDAAVNPFFIHFFNGTFSGSNVGAEHGIFIGADEIMSDICPGIVTGHQNIAMERDPTTADIVIGLRWVLSKLSKNEGAHASSVNLVWMEFMEAIAEGKVVDLASNSSRTSPAALRSAWHVGLNSTEDIIRGIEPTGRTGNGQYALSRFHGAGFINTAEVRQHVEDFNDYSRRSYMMGPMFKTGQSLNGDAKTTVTYDYRSDGSIREVDVRLSTMQVGHWGTRKVVALDGDSTIELVKENLTRHHWSSSALNDTGRTEPASYVPLLSTWTWEPLQAAAVNQFGLPAGAIGDSNPVFKTRYMRTLFQVYGYNNYSAHDDALSWVGDREERFTWDTFEGATLAQDTDWSLMKTPDNRALVNSVHFDSEYLNLAPGNIQSQWAAHIDEFFKRVSGAKDLSTISGPADLMVATAINFGKEITYRTGDPAIQKFLNSLIVSSAQTYDPNGPVAGATFRNLNVIDRQLWNRDLHAPRGLRDAANTDYLPLLLPSAIAAELPMVLGTQRVVLDRLGLVGHGREQERFTMGEANFRTIYDAPNEQAYTGMIHQYLINTGYDYSIGERPAVPALTSWHELVPHFQLARRFFNTIGETRSYMSLLGILENAAAAGSNVDGLEGYRANIPAETIADLNLVNIETGAALAGIEWDFNVLEDMLSVIAGSDENLYWNALDISFVFIDQDFSDLESCRLAAMRNVTDNAIVVGPVPLIVVFSKDGKLLQRSDSVEATSQVSNTPAPQADTPAPTKEEVAESVEELVSDDN